VNRELQQSGISHTIFAAGDSNWFGNVAAPLAKSLEEVIPRHVGDIPVPVRQRMHRGAVNDLVGFAVIGITLFVTKKIADDFYDVVLKPRVRKCFEWLDDKLTGGNRKTQKVFVSNIWYQEHHVVESVAVVGKDFAEVVSHLNLLGSVHSNALSWIAEHGVSAPVHHYKIENGQVNAEPLLLERADEAVKPYRMPGQSPQ
jgi:hypothetical protein